MIEEPKTPQKKDCEPPANLAERFKGRLGRIASGGKESLSESNRETFADYLESKRRTGHL